MFKVQFIQWCASCPQVGTVKMSDRINRHRSSHDIDIKPCIDYLFKVGFWKANFLEAQIKTSNLCRWLPQRTGTEWGRISRWPRTLSPSGLTMHQGWALFKFYLVFLLDCLCAKLYLVFLFGLKNSIVTCWNTSPGIAKLSKKRAEDAPSASAGPPVKLKPVVLYCQKLWFVVEDNLSSQLLKLPTCTLGLSQAITKLIICQQMVCCWGNIKKVVHDDWKTAVNESQFCWVPVLISLHQFKRPPKVIERKIRVPKARPMRRNRFLKSV